VWGSPVGPTANNNGYDYSRRYIDSRSVLYLTTVALDFGYSVELSGVSRVLHQQI
jgi:hypothetical protein